MPEISEKIVEVLRVTPRPNPEWVRGRCPECGDHLVSNCYYVGGRGHVICWECWSSLQPNPTCSYRKVI